MTSLRKRIKENLDQVAIRSKELRLNIKKKKAIKVAKRIAKGDKNES